MLYYVVEWATCTDGYGLFLSPDEVERDVVASAVTPTAATHSVGTVDATDETEAAAKVNSGKWSYSHFA